MFYVLHASDGATTYRINTDLIAYIASRPSVDAGRMVAEIAFSGGAEVKLALEMSVWEKFVCVLHTKPA